MSNYYFNTDCSINDNILLKYSNIQISRIIIQVNIQYESNFEFLFRTYMELFNTRNNSHNFNLEDLVSSNKILTYPNFNLTSNIDLILLVNNNNYLQLEEEEEEEEEEEDYLQLEEDYASTCDCNECESLFEFEFENR